MGIVATALLAGGLRAETEAEYLHPGAPKPRVANPATFAPAAALTSRRMSDQQREEWRFLKEASAAGRFETEASRLAMNKSGSAGIRSLATALINHHTSVSDELVHMLHVRGMAPPMLANGQRKTLNRLAKLRGAKFDRTYMEEVGLNSQLENLQLYEKARLGIGDPQLKTWIEKMLPELRQHVAMAERLGPPNTRQFRGGGAAAGIQPAAARRSPRSG